MLGRLGLPLSCTLISQGDPYDVQRLDIPERTPGLLATYWNCNLETLDRLPQITLCLAGLVDIRQVPTPSGCAFIEIHAPADMHRDFLYSLLQRRLENWMSGPSFTTPATSATPATLIETDCGNCEDEWPGVKREDAPPKWPATAFNEDNFFDWKDHDGLPCDSEGEGEDGGAWVELQDGLPNCARPPFDESSVVCGNWHCQLSLR